METRLLVFGGSGLVGSHFIKIYRSKFLIKAPLINEVDILNKDQLDLALEDFRPDVTVNFAAFTNVQGAEEQKGGRSGLCYLINVRGAKNIADACSKKGVYLIHISTDYVFNGTKSDAPYTEEDTPDPKNWYGQTKYFAEQEVLNSGCKFSIVRIAMPFSPHYELKKDIARFFLEQLNRNRKIKAISDARVTPIFVEYVANALFAIIKKRPPGLFHVVSTNWTTPFEFAKLLAKEFNLDASLVEPITLDEYNKDKKAPILKYSWLDPTKFIREFGDGILATVEENIKVFRQEIEKD
ncbi:MAG: NAD(P)-dependent oxidoreductase [Patescibacteria group bacterium]